MDNIHVIDGGKSETSEVVAPTTPLLTYAITLKNGKTVTRDGYLVATSAFIAVARGDKGDLVYLVPLDEVQDADLVEES